MSSEHPASAARRLADRLGLAAPLLQAPMAGVQGVGLAVAVTGAGGLGALPAAMLDTDALDRALAAFRSASRGPLNVNFFCHAEPEATPALEAAWRQRVDAHAARLGLEAASPVAAPARRPFHAGLLEVLRAWKPEVVSFHFGLPAPDLLDALRAWPVCILSSATTVEEALWLQARGVDAVIAQGLEAGGHRGHFLSDDLSRQMGSFALLPQVVQAVSVPVVAAGGIADAAGVRAALALGAAGVQVGTAFLLSPECSTSAVHRVALRSEAARHTALTRVYSGRPARGIENGLMRELAAWQDEAPAFPRAAPAAAAWRAVAEARGLDDFTPLWAGQRAAACQELPAAEVVAELMSGWVP